MKTPDLPVKRRILITGAAGRIGSLAVMHLAKQFDLILTDCRPLPKDRGIPFILCNLTDIETLRICCNGVDIVLHLGAVSDPAATWDDLLPANIIGARNLFQAACEAGCQRVIYASSVMTVDAYPPDISVGAAMPAHPSTLYGVSKAWGETLGRYYAEQKGISVIALRLGWVTARGDRRLTPGYHALSSALTEDDLLRLLSAALNAPADLKFAVFNGVSDNQWKRLDIEDTRQTLGYAPQEDAFALARRNYPAIFRQWTGGIRRVLRKIFYR